MTRNFILRADLLFVFFFVILVFVGIQAFVLNRVRANTTLVANAPCVAEHVSAGSDTSMARMDVTCGGHKDWTNDTAFIIKYLQHPGPFTCTLYQNQSHAECVMTAKK